MAFLLKNIKEFCVLSDGSGVFKIKNKAKRRQTRILLRKDIRNNLKYLDKIKLEKRSFNKKENENYRNQFLL